MVDDQTSQKIKSFWKRPEGITGTIFLIAAAVLIFAYANPILTFLIALTQNTITFVALLVVLGLMLYVILDPKFRNLIWFMYRSFMRWITGLFVQLDPIKVLESYIEYLYKNLKEMDAHVAKLKGQMSKLKRIILTNQSEMEQSLKVAEAAKKKGNMELVAINTRQYGRLRDSNEKYQVLLNKMELLYKVLSKIHKNSEYLIKDTENEVRMRKQEAIAIRAGHNAMKRAMNIIKGDTDKKMIFDMATEALAEDVHNKIGEMERFIEISGSFIDSIDLQNGIYEQEGLDLLEKMEKEGVSFLLGDAKMPESDVQPLDKEKDKDIGNISNYSNLFD